MLATAFLNSFGRYSRRLLDGGPCQFLPLEPRICPETLRQLKPRRTKLEMSYGRPRAFEDLEAGRGNLDRCTIAAMKRGWIS